MNMDKFLINNNNNNNSNSESKSKSGGNGIPMPSMEDAMESLQQALGQWDTLGGEEKKEIEEFVSALTLLQSNMDAAANTNSDSKIPQADFSNVGKLAEAIKTMRMNESIGVSNDTNIDLPGEKRPKGITITPEPGFVVKTKRNNLQTKVFINVCTHEVIDKPGVKKKLDDKGEEVEGINIPMSVGANRKDHDKAGAECYVYDIIVNPSVLIECKEDKTGKHRDFICQLAIQSLEQKYNEDLDRRYTLPKLKYMGTITSQHVRDRKSEPKIEEVSSSSAQSKAKPKPRPIQVVEVDLPYALKWLKQDNTDEDIDDNIFDGHKGDYIEPTMRVDDSILSLVFYSKIAVKSNADKQIFNDADIQLSPYKLSIKIQGYKGVTLYLPFAINPARVKCLLKEVNESYQDSKDNKFVEVRVVMEIARIDWEQEYDPGSQPWLIAKALDTNDGANPYDTSKGDDVPKIVTTKITNNNELPEDKFHVKLPSNVDPYTGVKLGNANDDFLELPEDKFHKKDAGSQYLINQREEAVKNKTLKAEKEREERKNDPNVEYIDVDAFRPGGKYYDKNNDKAIIDTSNTTANNDTKTPDNDILKRAADIVSTSTNNKDGLSSTIWSELL